MIAHPDFRRALARARSEELQATAAGWRRARQARAAARPAAAKRVTYPDVSPRPGGLTPRREILRRFRGSARTGTAIRARDGG